MFDIVMYRGVNNALITTITWVFWGNCCGRSIVCATEATNIIGQHNPLCTYFNHQLRPHDNVIHHHVSVLVMTT